VGVSQVPTSAFPWQWHHPFSRGLRFSRGLARRGVSSESTGICPARRQGRTLTLQAASLSSPKELLSARNPLSWHPEQKACFHHRRGVPPHEGEVAHSFLCVSPVAPLTHPRAWKGERRVPPPHVLANCFRKRGCSMPAAIGALESAPQNPSSRGEPALPEGRCVPRALSLRLRRIQSTGLDPSPRGGRYPWLLTRISLSPRISLPRERE